MASDEGKGKYDRALFEATTIGLALCRMDGELVDVNKAYAQLFGRSVEETLQLTYWDITPKEYAENEQLQLRDLEKMGRYGPYEKEYIHKNGHRIPVRLSGTLVKKDGERFIWSTVEDITDRKQAEEQLEFIRNGVDQAADAAFWIRLEDASFSYVNKQACESLGYTHEEFLSMSIFDIHPDFQKNNWKIFQRYIKNKKSLRFESIHQKKDGGTFPVERNIHLISFQEKEYLIAFARDITERKIAGEALQKAHDSLEIRVKERTTQLNAYSQRLEQSNKDLESFAYLASHDLQEPLRKIITFGDRVIKRSKNLEEADKNYLQRMQKAALRMRSFIDDLLEMSKVESTARALELTILNDLVKDVLEDMEVQINKTRGQVSVGNLPDLEVDPILFSKLLQNLISNSLKYHKDGIPPIIKMNSFFNERINYWEISVEDNGIGFDEKYLDRIFKPFERLHGKDEYEGTGIGLAICKKIVLSLEGKISARSKLGEGSTFVISLPKKTHLSPSPKPN